MQITGTVIALEMNATISKADNSGTYPGWRLTFRGEDGKVQEVAKHANSLKFGPGKAIREGLLTLTEGDKFYMVLEKKGQYNEVMAVGKGEAGPDDLPVPSRPEGKPATSSVTVKSNYETADERAVRQRLIVRQSSLSNALQYFEITKGKPTVDEVADLAEAFTKFVFETKEVTSE